MATKYDKMSKDDVINFINECMYNSCSECEAKEYCNAHSYNCMDSIIGYLKHTELSPRFKTFDSASALENAANDYANVLLDKGDEAWQNRYTLLINWLCEEIESEVSE